MLEVARTCTQCLKSIALDLDPSWPQFYLSRVSLTLLFSDLLILSLCMRRTWCSTDAVTTFQALAESKGC